MWNLITIDTVKQSTAAAAATTGSPQYMTHDKFHHTFTLPLWNKFAPLTIYTHHHHHHHNKEFPEFKKQIDKKSIIECKNYLNNQDGYDRFMAKQKIDERCEVGGNPPLPSPPPISQIVGENEKIDKNDKEKQQQQIEKKKKRRRRKNRNKRNKNKTQSDNNNNNNNDDCNKSIKIESKLQRCNSLNLIKKQRQRQISTDSDDSFIVFFDNNCNTNDNDSNSKNSLIFNNNNNNDDDDCSDNTRSLASDKKVRFADNNELCEIHPMVKWSYAYQAARKGPWEQYARDRDRFKKRIRNLERILSPIFNDKHRTRIYQERFN